MENDVSARLSNPTATQAKTAFAGAAPAVNRFVATLGPTGLRVAFLEEDADTTPYFRTAVTMHPQDGIALYKMLQGVLHDFELELDRQMATQNVSK
jgi:hypothetical protein